MKKYIRVLGIALIALLFTGCGGEDVDTNTLVNIRDLRYDPFRLNVPVGATVTWRNLDSATHTVTSGTLGPTATPSVVEVAVINFQFVPDERRVRVGDTIRWVNRDQVSHQISFLANQPITFTSQPFGENQTVSLRISRAGVYDYVDSANPAIRGRIIAEGVPNPDGRFDSEGIDGGESFRMTFLNAGDFSYFCKFHNIEEGVIVVR